MSQPLQIRGLVKTYGARRAVDDLDLTVEQGEVFALLGPNGAGKSTTVEILEGFRRRDAGTVTVLGEDPATAGLAWRDRLGIVLQSSTGLDLITVREAVASTAKVYSRARDVDEVIAAVGLTDKAGDRVGKLSGGQRRRVDVALGILGRPEVLFLDEPTTGFDPSARRHAWEMIAGLRDLGKTVLLTTHYMDEAQFLADRVAIINEGHIVAEDTPENLGDRDQLPTRITFHMPEGVTVAELSGFSKVSVTDGDAVIETHDAVNDLNRITGWAIEKGVDLDSLEVRRPSLEDVYLEVTES